MPESWHHHPTPRGPDGTDDPVPATLPTMTVLPTSTQSPTRPMFWSEIVAINDAAFNHVLMETGVDISANGYVVWVGAFHHTATGIPVTVGRFAT